MEEIRFFIDELLNNGVAQSHLGAFLMATCINGLNTEETFALTKAMTVTGDTLSWPQEWASIMVDKHSTGGVGDKVSIFLLYIKSLSESVRNLHGDNLRINWSNRWIIKSIPWIRKEGIFHLLKRL